MEKLILITSGRGPAECERAAYLVMKCIEKEAKRLNVETEQLSVVTRGSTTFVMSAVLLIRGEEAAKKLVREWTGTILWQAQSPFRPHHKRKNWFVSVSEFTAPLLISWNERDVKYESMRSSGPGGQHVNKTESAVRATHIPTGESVVASDERSQSMNKQKATERLKIRVAHLNHDLKANQAQEQWEEHATLERGNARRVIMSPLD